MFFRTKLSTMAALAALGVAAANAQDRRDAPGMIVQAAQAEVQGGEIVETYLDTEITTSDVYRVLMRAPDMDRRLTIRGDGVVLKNERMYEPISYVRRESR